MDQTVTKGPSYLLERKGIRVAVTDGELTAELGGGGDPPDATVVADPLRQDNAWNFIVIERVAGSH